ncbi:efflux transporter outer membrane subunit [Galbibacter pacificus]|uniref:Efflux transporter outer membrane subunit n=1 Tax=Galbibacter pacificus TaxID=2996052 RepID=A0ABT6FQ36_9FLAO|nr:efflux transporter outer membrane subunit [Galbibacter pacificus]MDG3582145.1 efflux transporter outer membrane subunit [Galbibacter pacificus]MDG3585379.1 efflux transporter outer membrane subunit [Galbibacter pacificus]
MAHHIWFEALTYRYPQNIWVPLLFCALLFFTNCAPKLDTVEAPIDNPDEFSYNGTQVIPDKWWTVFNDKQLNILIDSALNQNLNLAATWEQVMEAHAIRRSEASFLWPQIDAGLQTGISRPQPDFAGGENTQLGLTASYELDLWGRLRSSKQAANFRLEASYFDYQATAMMLSAEIAATWFQYVTALQQLQLANKQIETNQDIMKLIRVRFSGGTIRGADILRQQQLLEATQNQKIVYQTNIELLKNQLSVLLGKPPQNELSLNPDSLPQLPPIPDTGLPLDLVRRRPDVKQAYNLVLVADRDMAAAIANRYPRLTLTAATQLRSNDFNNLFEEWAYTLGANIVAPLIYGGRLNAEVDRAEAVKNQTLYQYGQTVLTAFREVEDALIQEQMQKEQITILENRLILAQKTNRQLRIEFVNGLSEYLDVLLALDQEQQLRRDVLSARQELINIRISLYRALAGAFKTERENQLEE